MKIRGSHAVVFAPFRLTLLIEKVEDGGYLATSPLLEGFWVQADTLEEVTELAPWVAKALLEAMHEKGVAINIPQKSFASQ